tara:strand:- start:279 stop:1241 length:963 start_codon:yes stop_codon:yes gene_type:complete
MGFKMKGTSMHSGTSAHKSALKIKSVEARKQEVTATGQASATPAKANAYGGDRSWKTAQTESVAAGGDLNQTTREQKAYEKKMKSENPGWNKRDDNDWKVRQNTINAAVGSKKVYEVDAAPVVDNKKTVIRKSDGAEVMKGIGAQGGKTLEKDRKVIETNLRDDAKSDIKAAKEVGDVDAKNEGQAVLRSSQAGDQDKYTGTVASRTVGKINQAINKSQIKRRENKRTKLEKRYEKRTSKGKSTKRLEKRYEKKGGDVEDLGTSPAKHTGSASHPTGAIAAHKGHKSLKKTKGVRELATSLSLTKKIKKGLDTWKGTKKK